MKGKNIMTTKENEKALTALVNEVLNAKNTLKTVENTITDIVNILKEGITGKDWTTLVKVLFTKTGNTTFYSLYMNSYLKDNGVFFEYNVKKDKLFYFGNIKEIKQTYQEWKEEKRKERLKEKESLSKKERVLKDFSKVEKLDKESLKILSEYITGKLHKTL